MSPLADTLRAVAERVARAREILDDGHGGTGQAGEAQQVLVAAEDLLGDLVIESSIDGHTAQVLLTLRDQLAGYLLAAELLADIDHLSDARMKVLRRGADEATAGLEDLSTLSTR
jgi:hypothetical protein